MKKFLIALLLLGSVHQTALSAQNDPGYQNYPNLTTGEFLARPEMEQIVFFAGMVNGLACASLIGVPADKYAPLAKVAFETPGGLLISGFWIYLDEHPNWADLPVYAVFLQYLGERAYN